MGLNLNLKISDKGIRTTRGSATSHKSERGVFDVAELQQAVKDNPGFRLNGDTIVVGNDDGAIEAALVALRCGSDSTTIMFPQRRDDVPDILEKAREAQAEGVKVAFGWGKPSLKVHTDGRVSGAAFYRCTRTFDDKGSLEPVFDYNDTITRYCDNFIFA